MTLTSAGPEQWLAQFNKWQVPISRWLALVLLAVSAWLLGKMVWMSQSEQVVVTAWSPSSSTARTASRSVDVTSIQKSELFGHYNQVAPTAPVVRDAPKTKLSLTLMGVVASDAPDKSLAVIANKGSQSTYGLNEVIEGTRVKLKAVMPDRVIIDNEGRDETLMLEGVDYTKLNAQPQAAETNQRAAGTGKQAGTSREEVLASIRDEIAQNPQQIFQYVRLSPVKQDDKLIGYRVSPGKNPELFESTGLQNGDIAKQLNGLDLTNPETMNQVFQTINDTTELTLTVERDEQLHEIYIQF